MHSVQKKALRPRQEVATLPLYNAGISIAAARLASGRQDIAALASNENPHGTSPAVPTALGSLVPSRYSDSACTALRRALSAKLGADSDRIVCGNGSEELIAALCRAYLGKGDAVLTIAPCFGLHEIEAMAAGAQVTKVPMTAAFDYDVDALVRELARGPKIVFISSPSNPVGKALSRPQLDGLLDAVQPETLFVLDEAYFELIDPDYPDGLGVLADRAGLSWVVLRTFSKAYGLAGLRVGYGITSDDGIARSMRTTLTPFNVNAAAQVAAIAALGDEGWMRGAVAQIRRDRTLLADRLRVMGVGVIPSQTNFLFLDLATEAASVADALLRKGIIVKPWREAGYTNFLRVSIGTAGDNERFARELGHALGLA
ncbi:histidinol-phosphate transaminase [Labrys neptuniae]